MDKLKQSIKIIFEPLEIEERYPSYRVFFRFVVLGDQYEVFTFEKEYWFAEYEIRKFIEDTSKKSKVSTIEDMSKEVSLNVECCDLAKKLIKFKVENSHEIYSVEEAYFKVRLSDFDHEKLIEELQAFPI